MCQKMKVPTKPKRIDIYVEAVWEKSDSKYCKSGFRGQWEIVKCEGHPEINGGCYTPDMMCLFPTVESLKEKFIKEYGSGRYPEHRVEIHIKVVKDDRNPTLESFFG